MTQEELCGIHIAKELYDTMNAVIACTIMSTICNSLVSAALHCTHKAIMHARHFCCCLRLRNGPQHSLHEASENKWPRPSKESTKSISGLHEPSMWHHVKPCFILFLRNTSCSQLDFAQNSKCKCHPISAQ